MGTLEVLLSLLLVVVEVVVQPRRVLVLQEGQEVHGVNIVPLEQEVEPLEQRVMTEAMAHPVDLVLAMEEEVAEETIQVRVVMAAQEELQAVAVGEVEQIIKVVPQPAVEQVAGVK
jgi:hypothetical protein